MPSYFAVAIAIAVSGSAWQKEVNAGLPDSRARTTPLRRGMSAMFVSCDWLRKHAGCGFIDGEISYLSMTDTGAKIRGLSQEACMSIDLDHTIVPAHDKEASARFLARILGLRYDGPVSHFAPLKINDTLTLDFDNDT